MKNEKYKLVGGFLHFVEHIGHTLVEGFTRRKAIDIDMEECVIAILGEIAKLRNG